MAEDLSKQSSSSSDLSLRAAEPRAVPSRSPSGRRAHLSSPSQSHRQSFTDQLRGFPPSPRSTRHLSLSQLQIQELLNNPPKSSSADPAFAGRDWQHISIGELVHEKDLLFVEWDTSVEAATNVGMESGNAPEYVEIPG